MAADYARSGAGLALTIGPLWLLQPAATIGWALGGAAALFFVYFARTVVRHHTCVELDEEGIRIGGALGAWIRWDELCSVRLNYYTTRNDRSGGWMQLDLRGARRSISVDSRLRGFAVIAGTAAREASQRGYPIDARTRSNLNALGIAAGAGAERDA